MCECSYLKSSEEGLRFLGTGVMGVCKPLDVSSGNQTWSSARAVSTFAESSLEPYNNFIKIFRVVYVYDCVIRKQNQFHFSLYSLVVFF